MQTDVLPWLDYQWSFTAPVGMYRAICERLRGTPARLDELLRDATEDTSRRPEPDRWSIREHAGHLTMVDGLWQKRIREYLAGAERLTAADMRNTTTEQASFNERPLPQLLEGFRRVRSETMALLDPLTLDHAARTAHHPRLGVSMRLVDLCTFMAEHDDHHLAAVRALQRLEAGG